MESPANICPTLSCSSRAMRRLSSSCNSSRRAERLPRLWLAVSSSAVRSRTRFSSSPCAVRSFSFSRRRASARATMTVEANRNARAPIDRAGLGTCSVCLGMSQYIAPLRTRTMVTIDGPTPQYQAAKATTGKRMMYVTLSPIKGFSERQASRQIRVAAMATT